MANRIFRFRCVRVDNHYWDYGSNRRESLDRRKQHFCFDQFNSDYSDRNSWSNLCGAFKLVKLVKLYQFAQLYKCTTDIVRSFWRKRNCRRSRNFIFRLRRFWQHRDGGRRIKKSEDCDSPRDFNCDVACHCGLLFDVMFAYAYCRNSKLSIPRNSKRSTSTRILCICKDISSKSLLGKGLRAYLPICLWNVLCSWASDRLESLGIVAIACNRLESIAIACNRLESIAIACNRLESIAILESLGIDSYRLKYD